MKKAFYLVLVFVLSMANNGFSQQTIDPWTVSDLESPANLAASIQSTKADPPLIISVGPAALIKGSIDIGPAEKAENLGKLKALLSKQPKDRSIVIYCGCCPFAHCPNIRPAFTLLKALKFTNGKLLDLAHNIRTDWIDKGYPTAK